MSSQIRANLDNGSERQNLMTGHELDATARSKRPHRKFTRTTQELAAGRERRNWKGLFLSLLVIIIVCVIVGISSWLLQPSEDGDDYEYTYDLDAMFNMDWKPYYVKGKWIGDSFVYQDGYMSVMKKDQNGIQQLISNETMESLGIYRYSVSPDFEYALLAYNLEQIYRHSTKAKYYIFTIETGSHVDLHDEALQYAEWGARDNQLVFVFEADIYYKSDVQAKPIAITNSGAESAGNIINGIADWIYEEEMFSSTAANWVSTDGSYLAYVSFNETYVDEVDIVVYDTPYPTIEKIKYPKVGYENPRVQLFVTDLKSKKRLRVGVPKMLRNKEPLLNSVTWASDDTVLVTWSDRYQNTTATLACTAHSVDVNSTLACTKVHEQYADGWIQYIGKAPTVGSPGIYFQIQEKTLGGRGKYNHLLMVNHTSVPTSTAFLTSGIWEVTEILRYDEQRERVYFIANKESPGDRHLYSVDLQSRGLDPPRCHTCRGTCTYNKATMSSTSSHAFVECLGPHVLYFSVQNLDTGEETILEGNYDLQARVNKTKMPAILYETVTVTGENGLYDLKAKLYLPPTYREMKIKIPLLVSVYGGPGSQEVDSTFSLDWRTFLVSNSDIAVMVFDGRGSGFQGSNLMKEVNRRFGVFEIEDQITAIKQVLAKHPILDAQKVGIQGWSYGGYAAAMVASHPDALRNNLIKCAISVAPVTDWMLYDSIYTERYMGSPVTNYNRYVESSLLPRAAFFKSFNFLLIHGTKDDNVHFQNSAVLEAALVRQGVEHRYQVYTDESHSLTNELPYTQMHLVRLMTDFLAECYSKT